MLTLTVVFLAAVAQSSDQSLSKFLKQSYAT